MSKALLTMALMFATASVWAEKPPNIVFILADDLGYADTGATGARTIRTPHIDGLAADGLTMTNAYSASPICSPTRTALLTGRYPQRYEIGLEEPLISRRAANVAGVPVEEPTIASLLKDLGYKTSLVGKWHLGIPPTHSPMAHGYDEFFGFIQGAADYFRHKMVRGGKDQGTGLMLGSEEVEKTGYLTDLLGDEAVRQIDSFDAQPFFLSLHFNAPHWPWEGRMDQAVADGLELTQHYDGGTLETYREMVEVMDENIGRVLAALENRGFAENTIVIFSSDNGGERFSDTWPHIGVKGEVLEGGVRVPLFIRWLKEIESGARSTQVISTMDFLPTLVTAAGGNIEELELDGINLLSQIRDGADSVSRTLFWRFKAGSQGAVRKDQYKYVVIGNEEYLFDVENDPRERAQLEKRMPERFDELKGLYDDWNATVLPYSEASFSEPVSNGYVDRY